MSHGGRDGRRGRHGRDGGDGWRGGGIGGGGEADGGEDAPSEPTTAGEPSASTGAAAPQFLSIHLGGVPKLCQEVTLSVDAVDALPPLVSSVELAAFDYFMQAVPPNPRAIKRILNTYQLIAQVAKHRPVSEDAPDTFVRSLPEWPAFSPVRGVRTPGGVAAGVGAGENM